MKPEKIKPAPPPRMAQFPPKPAVQLPPFAATARFWKNRKPRLPSGDPYWPLAPIPDVLPHGPRRTLPGMVAGTCEGVAEPLGHFSGGEVTPLTVLPSGRYTSMLSLPELARKESVAAVAK